VHFQFSLIDGVGLGIDLGAIFCFDEKFEVEPSFTDEQAVQCEIQNQVRKSNYYSKIQLPHYLKHLGDMSDKTILEMGCADGYYNNLYHENNAKMVVGIDTDPWTLAQAQ
jgi:hypothetical protein